MKVLNCLKNGKKISREIEKETGMYKPHVSRTLKELKDKGLIKCLNPKDRNYKFYTLSQKGKETLVKSNKIKEIQ